MLIQAAEESFHSGLRAYEDGRTKEALALFEAAIEVERRLGSGSRPQARYLSYYGLCLGLVSNDTREGLRFCREAVTLEGYNADIRFNLGVLMMRNGRRKDAYVNFTKGLSMEVSHRGIRRSLRRMGVRRRPVLPFLSRSHPLNVLLGRMRSQVAPA